ncbi:ribonuclease III [Caloranaerobacter azorensis]|uniref:Ribonuclease 3 n=2 Tax=Caloranaerobacter azorensis TaxID=116090 RepID=A0A096DPI0_9FIRM|nr:ribonuclease III [Caloranaerobacter azorensis]KGG81146.1 ribonuclease III [Caloranaerobacter azorensis H53214]QIB26225.1 ribonuclease III [Caloranaerobacter azorensis]
MSLHNERMKLLEELQEKIGYRFCNINLLNRALTHSSYANEHKKLKIKYNERLEFLGDSVLGLVVSDYIFEKYPKFPEGELTKLRAVIVCETSLSTVAKKLNLGIYLLLGKGEEATGGRERISILADALEALIGSIYLDGGLKEARKFVLNVLKNIIEDAVEGKILIDYKTQLQEVIQKNNKSSVCYNVMNEYGPDHNKIFQVKVSLNNRVLGEGIGRSKKDAEQCAAKNALIRLGVLDGN